MEKEISYEAGIKELEKLVASLEKEDLPLEKSVELYEKGVALASRLNLVLQKAEEKVKLINRDAKGKVQITEFEAQEENPF